ncbi:MAG: HpcH/HpaI aldolase family protein [Dehalococcoidales bacterium]
MRKENVLRRLLNEGKPSLGTHVVTPWPGMFEVIGNSGVFDYIEYVSEYSTWTLPLFDEIGRTMELFPQMAVMIKIEEQARGMVATRAIDAGFQSVLFADVRCADDVKECIRYVRAETPEAGGLHGINSRRHSGGYGGAKGGKSTEDWVKEMNDVVVVVMIEKKSAIENLEEILSVKGVDMVQFGPSDYSISIGKPGQVRCPETQNAEIEMVKMALKKGIAPRVEANDMEEAKKFIAMGVRHFCIGTDLGTVGDWCKQQAKSGIASLLTSL